MGFEGIFNLDVGVPDFQSSVPSNSGEIGGLFTSFLGFNLGGISDTGDPVLVVFIFRFVFFLSDVVP